MPSIDPHAPALPALHSIFCSIPHCFREARWFTGRRRGGTRQFTVAVCRDHGIVAISRGPGNTIIILDFVLMPVDAALLASMLQTLRLCVRCHNSNNNGKCTYLMCGECCNEVGYECSHPPHARRFRSLFDPSSFEGRLIPTPETSLRHVLFTGRVKIMISCMHMWQGSPVRQFGHTTYHAAFVHDNAIDAHCIPFSAIPALTRVMLGIEDVDADRIIDLDADELQQTAIQNGVVTVREDQRGIKRMRWSVWVNLSELGRHTTLKDEERDPHRDYDNLGDIEAHVVVWWEDRQDTETHAIRLPRRRLLVEECTFFLADLTQADRAQLGIDGVLDTRIVADAATPLLSFPYRHGRELDAVHISMFVSL